MITDHLETIRLNREIVKLKTELDKLQIKNQELKKQLILNGVVCSFKIEVHTKNFAWHEIVLAKTINEAIKKVQNKYPNNTHISLLNEYGEPLF